MREIFRRSRYNPIISIDKLPIDAHAVLNPGATEHGGDVVLLLRVEDFSGLSSIYAARSKNGVTDWRIENKPILKYGDPRWHYEEWGCEDARITYVPEKSKWYITYTCYSPAGAAVGLACTDDFSDIERVGLIFSPNNKDAVLFPESFDGRWAALHRPEAGGGIENIWIAYSRDFIYWGEPHVVLLEGTGPAWDAVKVGSGPPPIAVPQGWLLIYHGAKYYAGALVYSAGAVILDRSRPYRVIAGANHSIFSSMAPYEQMGLVPNTVFPTGALLRGDELWMYYGAGDTSICLAVANINDLLNVLQAPR